VVFLNPFAGGGRSRRYFSRVQQAFADIGAAPDFVTTQSPEELEAKARREIGRGKKLLFVMGGDGTFQSLANAAFGEDVVLGILPAGGGNDFAAALRYPKGAVAATAAILQGEVRCVDLLRARTADGRERLFAGGGGVGLDAEAARYASGAYRHIPGRIRYIAAALRAFASFQPLPMRLQFPGEGLPEVEAEALLAAVLNSPTYGAGVSLAPDASVEDGWLNVALVEYLNLPAVLALLPGLTRSGELPTSHVKRWRARSVRVATDRPCFFHGDGEILGPAPVEVEVVPRAVRMLVPRTQ
jgi:diacylglycerol kinase (ATP)